METFEYIGPIGIIICAIAFSVIWKSFRALNEAERGVAKSINQALSRKVGKYIVLLVVCLVGGVIIFSRYSNHINFLFFLLLTVAQIYQTNWLKYSLPKATLPENYAIKVLNSNRLFVAGFALIAVSFLLRIF